MFENISGYKFVVLHDLPELRLHLKNVCQRLQLKGTILLSVEGINVMIAGTQENIFCFEQQLKLDERFAGFWFKHSQSNTEPFEALKIRIKPEIITFCVPNTDPNHKTGKYIKPEELRAWYKHRKDFIIVDTRNHFEFEFGAFDHAESLNLDFFTNLPQALEDRRFDKTKPIVTYCTGGVRCEKATLLLENSGFSEVYQLEGGILNYFEQCGSDYYHGECFVFDNRTSIDFALKETGTVQCKKCFGPVTCEQQKSLDYVLKEHCPACCHVFNKEGESDVFYAG